jgi:hypothetical protein
MPIKPFINTRPKRLSVIGLDARTSSAVVRRHAIKITPMYDIYIHLRFTPMKPDRDYARSIATIDTRVDAALDVARVLCCLVMPPVFQSLDSYYLK